MREYIHTKNLKEHDEISETLYDDKMRILLRPGNRLTGRGIEMIKKLGYKGIYIENHEADRREDIPLPKPLFDNETMLRMVAEAKESLDNVCTDNSKIIDLVHTLIAYVEDMFLIMSQKKAEHDLLYETQDMRMASNWILYHSIAVGILSAGISMMLGLDDERVKNIALGGMLHDTGKLLLGGDIYQKPEASEDEKKMLREHPEKMFRILQRETKLSVDTTYAVWQHHEKCDGSGYPLGITQDKIHISAQIVALASAFDNLTNITPYNKKPMTGAEAFEFLAGCGLYAVDCVQALRSFACIYSVGTRVQLSDGRIATVLKNVPDYPERPYLICDRKLLQLAYDPKLMDLVIVREE